jgi:hypothetical protein
VNPESGLIRFNAMIKIDDEYSLTHEPESWVLHYESMPFTKSLMGKVTECRNRDQWYYPNIKMALKRYMDQCLKDCDNVSAILNRIDEIEVKIDNLRI